MAKKKAIATAKNCIYYYNGDCYRKENQEMRCSLLTVHGKRECTKYCKYCISHFQATALRTDKGIGLVIQIPCIIYESFLKTKDGCFLKYACCNPFFLSLNIEFNKPETNAEVILNAFQTEKYMMGYNDCILTIGLFNTSKLRKLRNTRYDKLKESIGMLYTTDNEFGKLTLQLNFTKDRWLKMLSNAFKNKIYDTTNIQEYTKIQRDYLDKTTVNVNTNITEHTKNPPIHDSVAAIVLTDTRKCARDEHAIIDVRAKVRIVRSDSEIIDYWLPAAYCETCQAYYVLMDDFKAARRRGVILCQVEDKTTDYVAKHHNKSYSGGESKIHQMGYNVQKNNGLTRKQRHIILANMIENTDISEYEIKSLISRCIRQHQAQSNYANSVSCWREDLEFVNAYQLGDIPQVKLEKLTITGQKSTGVDKKQPS